MERQELFNEVKSWLEAEKIEFSADPENATFEGWMTTANGVVQVRLHCEESPAIVQVVCALPLKVPMEKTAETALFLHNLNACLRIGSFCLAPEQRMIVFRLTMPVRSEAELGHQFGEAFGTALGTWDEHLPPLALLLCSTKAAQKALARFSPEVDAVATAPKLPKSRRMELN
jgi:hypothetical protein